MNARLVLSLKPIMATAPASCIRPVHGNLTYEVVGWYPAAGNGQVWLLIPMTFTNLASLAIWIMAMRMGSSFGRHFDLILVSYFEDYMFSSYFYLLRRRHAVLVIFSWFMCSCTPTFFVFRWSLHICGVSRGACLYLLTFLFFVCLSLCALHYFS
jgi:hypothetical protein